MAYDVSSEKLEHPLMKSLLDELIPIFKKLEIKFFVIGATARDIIMELHGEKSGRSTKDIDIAIAVEKWEEFETIESEILKLSNFKKDTIQQQRFFYLNDIMLDIVPYGGIANEKDKIFWPPDQTFAMTVLGFKEAEGDLIDVTIDGDTPIKVISLTGIFVLKIFAWLDRHKKGNKDAEDIGFILSNYLSVNQERAVDEHYDKVYDIENFTISKAGAVLLGIDLNELLSANRATRLRIKSIIERELEQPETSILFFQLIQTNNIKIEEAIESFQLFLQQINND